MKTNEKFLSFYYRNHERNPGYPSGSEKNSPSDRGYAETFHRKKTATMHCSVRKPESGMNGNGFTIT